MKKTIITLLFSSLCLLSFAQYNLTLDVRNNKGIPEANRDVVFVESSTFEYVSLKTDAQGKLSHDFTQGKWLGSIGDMHNCLTIDASMRGRGTRSITYDPADFNLQNKSMPDRRSVDFQTVDQGRLSPMDTPAKNENMITIVLKDQQNKVYPGVPISVCHYATKTIYESRSNNNGAATFKLPANAEFELDVDGVENLRRFKTDPRPMTGNVTILYQPREFSEQAADRFVVQNIQPETRASSSHAKIKLKIKGGSKGGIQEDVYIRMLKSNTVYKGQTDAQGDVFFMLPIRQKYAIDFKFQRDADVIDLSAVSGIAEQSMTIHYIPDPMLENIENFIPKVANLIEYDINNFVNKQYPEPTNNDVDFYLQWGNKFNKNSKEALLEIGMKVKAQTERKVKTPLNICFVIDRSGSMSGEDRIERLKTALINFIGKLQKDDIISIVIFDDVAQVVMPAEALGNKQKATNLIHAIHARGGTIIYDGLELGFQEVAKNKAKNYVDRVVLLTDGYGSRPPQDVISMAKKYIAGGIELSAIGVGQGYNQALLSQLASAGGGLLHLAGTGSNIDEAFQAELNTILFPVAEKAMLEVKYNDQIVYRQLFGYANEKVSKGKMSVEIPHLFPGLDKMALVKFDLINPTKSILNEKVTVTLSYVDPTSGKTITNEKHISPEWTDATGELDMTIDKEHKKVLAVAIANQSLKVMANTFEAGDRVAAEKAVQSAIDQINALFPRAKSEELLALIGRLNEYVDAFEKMRMLSQY